MLEKGTACEFEVFLTAHCTCSIRDILTAAGMTTVKQSFNVQVDVEAETTISTKLHHDVVVAEPIGMGATVVSTGRNSTTTTLWSRRRMLGA